MNSCEKFRNMICTYVDGELSSEEEAQLFEHIKTCYDCKTELEMMKKTRACLKELPVVPLPEGFSEAFRQNLTKDKAVGDKKNLPFYRQWRTYTAVAAVVLFVFVLKSGLTDKDLLLNDAQPPVQSNSVTSQARLSAGAAPEADKTEEKKEERNTKTDNTVTESAPRTENVQMPKSEVGNTAQTEASSQINTYARSMPVQEQKSEMTDEAYDAASGTPSLASAEGEETTVTDSIDALTGTESTSDTPESSVFMRSAGGGSDDNLISGSVGSGGSGGGGSDDGSVVYKSVYRATDNTATVYVSENDVSAAASLFDIIPYTPAEIEDILSGNGITGYSIKAPLGDFDSYYVRVEAN